MPQRPRKLADLVFWWICDPARPSLGAIRLNKPGSVSDRAGASEGGAGCDPQLEHAHNRRGARATRPVHILRVRQHVFLIQIEYLHGYGENVNHQGEVAILQQKLKYSIFHHQKRRI